MITNTSKLPNICMIDFKEELMYWRFGEKLNSESESIMAYKCLDLNKPTR